MRFALILLAPLVCLAACWEEPSREKEAANPLREEYQKAAKKYEFFLDKERKVPLTFSRRPSLAGHRTMTGTGTCSSGP